MVHAVNRTSCSPFNLKKTEIFCSLLLPKEVKVGGQRFVKDRLRGPSVFRREARYLLISGEEAFSAGA